jgi:hypothetical protein
MLPCGAAFAYSHLHFLDFLLWYTDDAGLVSLGNLFYGYGWDCIGLCFHFSFSGVRRRKYGGRWREKRRILKTKQLWLIDWMYDRLGYDGTEYGRVGSQQDQQYCSIIYDWMYQKHRSLQFITPRRTAHPTSASAEVNQPGASLNRIGISILNI